MIGAHPARSSVSALVSGYPMSKRARKILVLLQAFIDDSAAETGDQKLVLAGYINTVAAWELFSDDWQAAMLAEPSIDYFKMSEARALQGQFRGWKPTDRDIRVSKMAQIIRRYEPESFHFAINRKDYAEVVAPHAPRGLASPHYTAAFGIVSIVSRYAAAAGSDVKVDFIFDQQSGVSADFALFFEYMIRSLPRDARDRISRNPIFRDDKEFLPLQAADMLAWHLRRQHEKGDVQWQLDKLFYERGGHLYAEANTEMLARVGQGLSEIPGAKMLQSKAQWQNFRRNLSELLSQGFVPPYGTKWKNRWFELKQSIRWLFQRRS